MILDCPVDHHVHSPWILDSEMCTFSSQVRRVWCAQRNSSEITIVQVRVGESDLKPHGSFLVSSIRTSTGIQESPITPVDPR